MNHLYPLYVQMFFLISFFQLLPNMHLLHKFCRHLQTDRSAGLISLHPRGIIQANHLMVSAVKKCTTKGRNIIADLHVSNLQTSSCKTEHEKDSHTYSHYTSNVQQSPIKAGLSNPWPSRPTHEKCNETWLITQAWLMYARIDTCIYTYIHTCIEKVYNIQNFTYRVIMNCNLVCYFLQKVETNCIQPEPPRTRNVKILACFITCFLTSKTTRLAEKA
jgi:hypothetical protein